MFETFALCQSKVGRSFLQICFTLFKIPLFPWFTDASRISWWASISSLTFKEGICIVLSSGWTCVSSTFSQQAISWISETTTQPSHVTSFWISSISYSEWCSLMCLKHDFNFFQRFPKTRLIDWLWGRLFLPACLDHLKGSPSCRNV